MKKDLVFTSLFGVALIFGVGAQTFSASTNPPSFNYDPFTATYSTGKTSANLSGVASTEKPYFWTIQQAPGSRYVTRSGYSIPVSFYKSGVTPLEEIDNGNGAGLTYTDVLYGTFLVGQSGTHNHNFDVIPQLGSIVPAGTYTGLFTFQFYRGIPGTKQSMVSTKSVTATVVVVPRADLALVGTGGAFNVANTSILLDFNDASGQMVAGTTRTAELIVKSNRSYNIAVTAPSHGYMVNSDQPTETIPYSFNFNGITYSLSAGSVTLVNSAGWTSTGERRYPISITIGAFDFVEPGTYAGSLTFTVSTN